MRPPGTATLLGVYNRQAFNCAVMALVNRLFAQGIVGVTDLSNCGHELIDQGTALFFSSTSGSHYL
jgi:hypothetical protein